MSGEIERRSERASEKEIGMGRESERARRS